MEINGNPFPQMNSLILQPINNILLKKETYKRDAFISSKNTLEQRYITR